MSQQNTVCTVYFYLIDLMNTIYELIFVPPNPEACDGDVNTCPFLYTWKNLHRWYVVAGDNCVHDHEYVHGKRICEGIYASANSNVFLDRN